MRKVLFDDSIGIYYDKGRADIGKNLIFFVPLDKII